MYTVESNTSEQVNATEEERLEGDTSIDPVDDGEDLREEKETEPQPQELTAGNESHNFKGTAYIINDLSLYKFSRDTIHWCRRSCNLCWTGLL